uniref:C2H2-type domain-containing protein n=1 Tax=Varanus komodoensis TaxID=61221 RepID=A0A8D2JES2_VARKO
MDNCEEEWPEGQHSLEAPGGIQASAGTVEECVVLYSDPEDDPALLADNGAGARAPFHCSECDKSFRYRSDLRRHFARHTELKPFQCPHCVKSFKHSFNLVNHIRSHTGERPYRCTMCPKGFRDSTGLLHHQVVHTGEKPYCCHKPYQCTECGKFFRHECYLKRHRLLHSGERPFKCTFCHKGFITLSNLSRHLKLHLLPFQGSQCKKTFPASCHLKHATVVSDLACPECGRTFKQRADLRRHHYVHTREKLYACSMCEKSFRHRSNLHIHLRTHSGERPYQCPDCGKAFSQSCNLRTHSQIHSGSKPYRCCMCGKAFSHSSNLTIHQRVHTGERPYPCSTCPKRFSDRSTLVQHERTHTGERPYACHVCEQRFSQISHLVKHSRVHPGARGPPKPPAGLAGLGAAEGYNSGGSAQEVLSVFSANKPSGWGSPGSPCLSPHPPTVKVFCSGHGQTCCENISILSPCLPVLFAHQHLVHFKNCRHAALEQSPELLLPAVPCLTELDQVASDRASKPMMGMNTQTECLAPPPPSFIGEITQAPCSYFQQHAPG